MDQFLLFGDSITQQSFSQARGFAFGAALADAYVRRLDVVNRGLSGYNSRQALKVINQIIPPPSVARLRFITIWFGANDSRLPNTPGFSQHVPLQEYVATMRKIITHSAIRAHSDVRVVLITPPPVEEHLQQEIDCAKFPDWRGLRRTAECNAAYAKAAKELASECDIACLDIWTEMMTRAGLEMHPTDASQAPLPGSKSRGLSKELADFLSDGLHFNPSGYQLVFDMLMKLIASTWPDQMPDKLPFILPTWDNATAWAE